MVNLENLLSKQKYEKAQKASFLTCQDVLMHFPMRYDNVEISDSTMWNKGDKVWLEGDVYDVKHQRIKAKLTRTSFLLQSKDHLYTVSIFNRPWLKEGMRIVLNAKVDGPNKLTAITYNTRDLQSQEGLNPIYSSSKLLSASDFKFILDKVIVYLKDIEITDIPQRYMQKYKLVSMKQAIYWMHKAKKQEEITMALRTLKYEEFLRFQTKLQLNRIDNLGIDFGKIKVFDRRLIEAWKKALPFQLTIEQNAVLDDILNDLQSSKRMYRLLQGDVGSGKTVIAALAMYANVLAKYQSAFLVPTEILAYQHFKSLKQYLPETVRLEVLSSSKSAKEKKDILERLKNGEIDCLIGTHSIIQDDVIFKNVGLVVADEQHRFGVKQRRKLSDKGEQVDFLLMSATPIPRTLASVVFGDLEVSTISAYHSSKQEVHTKVVHDNSLKPVLKEILDLVDKGQQVYVVCPAIVDNEDRSTKSVETITLALKKALPDHLNIESLHGKLKSDEKDRIMTDFSEHRIDFLVSTTVIEVGVNVANANVMVIYDADRFGLSQLHQLRGRVGRGEAEGYCYLLSDSEEALSLERLSVLEESSDGFYIANKDLELRGPGELFGLRQSGIPSFLVANVILDQNILLKAQEDSQEIVKNKTEIEFQAWITQCKKELNNESLD